MRAAAAVAVVLFAACASPAAVEPGATSTPEPTAAPTPMTAQPSASSDTQVVFAPPGILPPGSLAMVTGEGLRIRETPGLSGSVIATVGAGEVVLAGSFFPFQTNADGIDWYAVSFAAGYADWPAFPATWDVGWVAAGTGADRYLELLPPRCPSGAPDLASLTSMTPWDRLACFGDRPLAVAGTWGCRGCGGTAVGNFEPRWLAYPIVSEWLRVSWPDGEILELRIPPDSGIADPAAGSIARVTGHFDDPAASTCIHDGSGLVLEVDPEVFELYCREQFVVEGYDVIGTDPDFPP